MIETRAEIPENSILKKNEGSFDYIDSFQSLIFTKERNDDITTFLKLFIRSGPKWADHLLVIRDKIVGLFGLNTTEQITKNKNQIDHAVYNTGEQLGIFKLYDKSESEFLLGEDDKHLNFRVSLLIEQIDLEKDERRFSITTAVKFNNMFGRIYFYPVKPVHRLIVRTTLKNIVQQFERTMIENKETMNRSQG